MLVYPHEDTVGQSVGHPLLRLAYGVDGGAYVAPTTIERRTRFYRASSKHMPGRRPTTHTHPIRRAPPCTHPPWRGARGRNKEQTTFIRHGVSMDTVYDRGVPRGGAWGCHGRRERPDHQGVRARSHDQQGPPASQTLRGFGPGQPAGIALIFYSRVQVAPGQS